MVPNVNCLNSTFLGLLSGPVIKATLLLQGTYDFDPWSRELTSNMCNAASNNNNNDDKHIKFHLPDIYFIQVPSINIFPLNQLNSLNNLK